MNRFNGWIKLGIFLNLIVFILTFLSGLYGYNYYYLIPNPLVDLSIDLHNTFLDILGSDNQLQIAISSSLSTTLLTLILTFGLGYGINWVVQGFKSK